LEGKLRINESLARHTSFKIGGAAQFWFEPKNLSDLQKSIFFARSKRKPLRIIGAGSNILVDDRGIKGIVIKLNSPYFKRVAVNPALSYLKPTSLSRKGGINQQVVMAGAGVSLNQLIRYVQKFGLSGCELLAGIPGTVGGALIMNAGNIGYNVLNVTVMDKQGRVKVLNRNNIRFNYRSSSLNRYIILSVNFKLLKKGRKTVKKKIDDYLDYRQKTQDLSCPSAGCIFRNPNSKSAAYFVERCGLKGISFGDAAVSFKHANFIINRGKASFADILRLMAYITRCVKKRFNIDLKPEIRIWR